MAQSPSIPVHDTITAGDLFDLASKIKARAVLLQMVADGLFRNQADKGDAIGQLAVDMQAELKELMDGLESLRNGA